MLNASQRWADDFIVQSPLPSTSSPATANIELVALAQVDLPVYFSSS